MNALPAVSWRCSRCVFVGIGIALLAVTAANGGGVLGFLLGAMFIALGIGRLTLLRKGRSLVARKLRGFQRVLDAPALFSIAYGEIASSIYFALGIVAGYALGFTPLVLLVAGIIFLIVALSYAEGTAAIPETGGAATFVRRAFNDLLRLPDRLGAVPGLPDRDRALGSVPAALPRHGAGRGRPARLAVGCSDRRLRDRGHRRHPARAPLAPSTPAGSQSRGLDLATQLLLVILGLALLYSPDLLTQGTSLGTHPAWSDIAFALPLAMLAYTGLETVANLAEETREPGRTLPRSLFSAIGLVVVLTVLIAVVGLSAFPVENGQTALADEWLRAPLAGIVEALQPSLPGWLGDALRVYVGLTGALVLLAAATTSISGFTQARLLARRAPAAAAELRPAEPAHARLAAGDRGGGGDLDHARDRRPARWPTRSSSWRASTRSACCSRSPAAQLAVLRLRVTEPDLVAPFRAPLAAPLIGAPLVIGVLDSRRRHAPGRALRRTGLARSRASSSTCSFARRERSGLFHELERRSSSCRRVPSSTGCSCR